LLSVRSTKPVYRSFSYGSPEVIIGPDHANPSTRRTVMGSPNTTKDPVEHYTALGAGLGVAFGVAFGAAFDAPGMGIAIGLAVGVTIGAGIGARVKKDQDTVEPSDNE